MSLQNEFEELWANLATEYTNEEIADAVRAEVEKQKLPNPESEVRTSKSAGNILIGAGAISCVIGLVSNVIYGGELHFMLTIGAAIAAAGGLSFRKYVKMQDENSEVSLSTGIKALNDFAATRKKEADFFEAKARSEAAIESVSEISENIVAAVRALKLNSDNSPMMTMIDKELKTLLRDEVAVAKVREDSEIREELEMCRDILEKTYDADVFIRKRFEKLLGANLAAPPVEDLDRLHDPADGQ